MGLVSQRPATRLVRLSRGWGLELGAPRLPWGGEGAGGGAQDGASRSSVPLLLIERPRRTLEPEAQWCFPADAGER